MEAQTFVRLRNDLFCHSMSADKFGVVSNVHFSTNTLETRTGRK